MKKILICIFAVSVLLSGCGANQGGSHASGNQSGVAQVLEDGINGNTQQSGGGEKVSAKKGGAKVAVDVDLTTLGSTMVYSEVFAMMTEPEKYIGKTIKMNGTCNVYNDSSTGKDYYACIIQDATACCAQGIEFQLTDGSYPDEGDDITVVGKFGVYKEGDFEYYTLLDSSLV